MARGPTVSTTFNGHDRVSSVAQRIRRNVRRLAVASVAATGAAAVAIARQTVQFANMGDEIAKTSRRVGVSVEGLQELRFAADRSGLSASTLDTAIGRLNRNVGDLRAGTGTLATFLNRANPALAEQLVNVESTEEAFSLLTDQIASIENPMDRAALAQAAFGRAGQELIVMAENGSAGIESLREEARHYGNVISGDAAASSEQFVDSMTNLRAAALGVRNRALIPLMNTVTPLIQQVADWVANNQELIDQRVERAIGRITNAGRLLWRLWDSGLIPAVIAGVGAFRILAPAIRTTVAVVKTMRAAQWSLNAAMMANPIGLIAAAIAAFIAIVVLAIRNFDTWGSAVLSMLGPVGSFINMIVLIRRNWDSVKASFSEGGLLGGLKALGAVLLQSVLTPIQQILGLIERIPGVGRIAARLNERVSSLTERNQAFIDRHGAEDGDDQSAAPEEGSGTTVPAAARAAGSGSTRAPSANASASGAVAGDGGGADSSTLISRNETTIQSAPLNWRGLLQIVGAPAGSTIETNGNAPLQVTLDTGFEAAGS